VLGIVPLEDSFTSASATLQRRHIRIRYHARAKDEVTVPPVLPQRPTPGQLVPRC
jgi:hypothetical protein